MARSPPLEASFSFLELGRDRAVSGQSMSVSREAAVARNSSRLLSRLELGRDRAVCGRSMSVSREAAEARNS